MRNLKRALSLLLSSTMVLGMVVMGGSAAGYQDVDASYNQEAIEVLQAVGVMTGDQNGDFNPDDNVTRNEMAVVMANLLDLKVDDFEGTTLPFTDVPEWAAKYVAACYADGITAGTSATTYGGDQTVTAAQAALMMMKALGYFQNVSDFGSDWQVATVKQGSKINLFDGIEAGASSAMTRNEVAQIALNTLEATMVETDGTNTTITTGDVTINTGDTKYVDVTIAAGSYGDAIDDATDGTKDIVQLGEKLYNGDLKKNPTTRTDRMGRVSDYWTYDGKEIGVYAKEADATYVVADGGMNVNEILADSDYFNYNATQVGTATQAKTFLNGDNFSSSGLNIALSTTNESEELQKGDVVEVYLNNSNNVDTVVISRYSVAKIDEVETDLDSSKTDKGIGAEISLVDLADSSVGTVFYDSTNDKASASDKDKVLAGFNAATYTEGAYLAVALDNAGNEVVDSYVITPVTGAPSAFRAAEYVSASVIKNGYITLGGEQYTFAGTVYGVDNTTSFDFDSNYDVYATKEGYAIGVKGADAVNLNDVYYVVGLYQTTSDMGTASYYAQVVAMDGTVSSIKLEYVSFNAMLKKAGGTGNLYLADGTLAGTADSTATPSAGKLYVPAEASHLYTFTDSTAGGDSDAGNGKYTGNAYNGGTSYDVNVADVNGAIKGDDTRFSVDGGVTANFFISSSTKFIAAEKAGDDLKVTTATGGMKAADDTQVIVIAKDSTPRDAALVIYLGTDLSATVASDDVVYLAKTPTEQTADGYKATLYFVADNSTKEVILDKDDSATSVGFYVYDLENNVYTLTTTGLSGNITSTVDKDTEGYKENLAITAHYGNTMTATNFVDVDYSKALIMDNRSNRSSSEYANEITSAKRLGDAIDAVAAVGKALKVNVYVIDGNVTLVDVVGINSVAAPSISGQPSDETFAEGTASKTLTVTASGDGLSYQWYQGSDKVGTDSNTLDLSALSLTPGVYKFKVVVTSNKDGATNSTTSNEATVTVQPKTPTLTPAGSSTTSDSKFYNTLTLTAGDYEDGVYKIYQGGSEASGMTATRTSENSIEIESTANFDGSTNYTLTVTVNGVESEKSSTFTLPAQA